MTNETKQRRISTIAILFLVLILSICLGFGIRLRARAGETTSPTSTNMADLWVNEKFCTITSGETLPEYANASLLPDKAVKVVATGHDATVSFANVVNLEGLTKNDPFLNIFIAPETQSKTSQDFSKLKVRITDVEDEGNYMEISVHRSTGTHSIYFQAGTQDVEMAGRRSGAMSSGDGDRGLQISGFAPFEGLGTNAVSENVSPICIRYDYEEKAVYPLKADGITLNGVSVRDLDSMEDMGAGFEWKGFTSGRVKISISALNFNNATGTYYITNFLDMNMSQNKVFDTTAPNLLTVADTSPEILTGVVGRNYPLFDAVADDMVCGSLDIKKEIVTPSGASQVIEGDYYLPTVAGEHQLIYSAVDASGNKTQKAYILNVLSVYPEITLDLVNSLVSTAYVGEKIYLPDATTSGGVYEVDVQVEVISEKDGVSQTIEKGSFTPLTAGTYLVRYTATDFLGGSAVLTEKITVSRGEQPVCTFPILPTVFINGKTIALPTMTAWDYINDPSYRQNAVVEVYESKTAVSESNYGTKITDLSSYTPRLSDGKTTETVYITYITYCKGYEAQKAVKTYSVKLVELKQMYDLFDVNGITPTLTDSYIQFSAEEDGATMTYGMPISARQSEIVFDIKKGTNNFNVLRLTFTDSENSNQQVQMDITKTLGNAKSFVYVHGERFIMNGSFDETAASVSQPAESFKIKLAEDMGSATDAQNVKICNFSTYLDGSAFEGFDSGKIYVKFEFLGVSGESSINLKSFGVNQPVRGLKSGEEFVDFIDTGKPYIYISGSLSQVAELYESVYVPSAYAYDVIDMNVGCFVQVVKSTTTATTVFVDSLEAENGVSFIPDDYGIYTVTFTAKDAKGNTSTRALYVYVEDNVEPSLIIDGSYAETYSKGSKVVICEASAKDLQGEAFVSVFVIDTMNKATCVQIGDEISFEEKGRYVIRYCAFDVNYNYTIIDFKIDVK